jgi:hypothetical protein
MFHVELGIHPQQNRGLLQHHAGPNGRAKTRQWVLAPSPRKQAKFPHKITGGAPPISAAWDAWRETPSPAMREIALNSEFRGERVYHPIPVESRPGRMPRGSRSSSQNVLVTL